MSKEKIVRIVGSILIGVVFFVNVQAGIDFYLNPQKYTAAYELSGIPGEISVSGVGLLFIMWNVPYAFALWNPIKYRISLLQSILMQTLGVFGESILLSRISAQEFPTLSKSIMRFIYFDGTGLVFLLIAGYLVFSLTKEQRGLNSTLFEH